MCGPSSRLVVGGKGDKESKRVQFSVYAFFVLEVDFFLLVCSVETGKRLSCLSTLTLS